MVERPFIPLCKNRFRHILIEADQPINMKAPFFNGAFFMQKKHAKGSPCGRNHLQLKMQKIFGKPRCGTINFRVLFFDKTSALKIYSIYKNSIAFIFIHDYNDINIKNA